MNNFDTEKSLNNNPNIKLIPIKKAIKPKDHSTAYVNHWWCVKDDCILVYYKKGMIAPQCNKDKNTAENICKNLYPGARIKKLHLVFLYTD